MRRYPLTNAFNPAIIGEEAMDDYKREFQILIERAGRDWFMNDDQKLLLFRWIAGKASLTAAELAIQISSESKGE